MYLINLGNLGKLFSISLKNIEIALYAYIKELKKIFPFCPKYPKTQKGKIL